MTDKAIEILELWKEKTGAGRFVFGMIPDDFNLDDREALYKIRNTKTAPLNRLSGACLVSVGIVRSV